MPSSRHPRQPPSRPRRKADDPDAATIAIAALSYFATEPKTMSRFFALTGLDPSTIRSAASSPAFVAGLLDFVLADERILMAVAEAQDTTPEAIVRARHSLERRGPNDPIDITSGAADDGWPPRPHDDWA